MGAILQQITMKKKGFIPERLGCIKTGLTQPVVWFVLLGDKMRAWGWFAIGCMDFLVEM